MNVSAWSNGGGSYGLRIGKLNRDRYFDPSWRSVLVLIDGQEHEIGITSGFWRNCPEIRSPVIRDWLDRRRLLPWPPGAPPRFHLRPLGGRRFELRE